MRSLLRRRSWEREQRPEPSAATSAIAPIPPITFGDAVIDYERGEARKGDQEVKLTRLEFDLVRYFAGNPGRVLSRQELQEQVWKLAHYPNTRMVDNFIMRLRRHFEPDPANPVYFVSVRGTGYKFVTPTSPPGGSGAVTKP